MQRAHPEYQSSGFSINFLGNNTDEKNRDVFYNTDDKIIRINDTIENLIGLYNVSDYNLGRFIDDKNTIAGNCHKTAKLKNKISRPDDYLNSTNLSSEDVRIR